MRMVLEKAGEAAGAFSMSYVYAAVGLRLKLAGKSGHKKDPPASH